MSKTISDSQPKHRTYVLFQLVHQFTQLGFEFGANGDEGQLALGAGSLAIAEQPFQQRIRRFLHEALKGSMQSIVVLLYELVLEMK